MKKNYLFKILTILFFGIIINTNAQTQGDIAFVGFNADGDKDFAIVLLADILSNTTIYFTDDETTGAGTPSALAGSEGTITWSTGSTTIKAGTVVVFTDVDNESNPSFGVSLGSISRTGNFGLSASKDGIIAFLGSDSSTPTTYIAAIQIGNDPEQLGPFDGDGITLTNTSLAIGTSILVVNNSASPDGGVYGGSRSNQSSYANYYSLLNDDATNWTTSTTNGESFLPYTQKAFTINTTNWTGSITSVWNLDGNWDNGVPTSSSFATIPDVATSPIVSSETEATVGNLTIDSGETLTLNSNNSLKISGELTIDGSLNLDSSSSLIISGTSSGTVTYKRNLTAIAGDAEGWHLVASPVSGETYNNAYADAESLATSTTNTSLRGLGFYATANDTWSYLVNDDSNAGTFSSGSGYTMKRASTGQVKFIGNLNTDDTGVDATISTAGNGFNLLGNPYTAFINNQTFLTDNTNIDQQIWVWDQTGGGNYEVKIAGAAFEIAPGQGFFVKANSGTAVNFAESNQSAQGTDTFLRTNSWTEVKLLMTDGEKNRFTKLYFTDNATTGFDAGWEGEVFGGIQNEIDVFTHLVEESQGKKYQVQSLPLSDLESLVIPLGVTVEAGKTATFSTENTNVPSNINVYIEDKQDNSFTLLEADANFSFTPENNLDGIGRFYIHTTTSSLSAADFGFKNTLSIYTSSRENLRVVGVQNGTANIQLYNILGKEVLKSSFEGNGVNDIALPKLNSGVYIVKIATETGTTNKKIIIQ
jgi:hypothetical protein